MKMYFRLIIALTIATILSIGIFANPIGAAGVGTNLATPAVARSLMLEYQAAKDKDAFFDALTINDQAILKDALTPSYCIEKVVQTPKKQIAPDVTIYQTGIDQSYFYYDNYDYLLWEFHQVVEWSYTGTRIYSIDEHYSWGAAYYGCTYYGLDGQPTEAYGPGNWWFYRSSTGHFYAQQMNDYCTKAVHVYGDGTYIEG